ncbi:F-box/LRR-repeat protein 12 [Aristolochia californica]|uniref:F-box/LRR-repeat protein 12 n=1 Tax=Aristolochia californica TaxID=171875 RepID=UPI0035D6C061
MFSCEETSVTASNLPDDCLFIVFDKLESSSDREVFGLTCRRWLHVQNSARNSLQLGCLYRPNVTQEYVRYLPRLLMRFQQLRSISLAGCTELPDSALTWLQLSGSKLQSLSLDCCFGITDNGLALVSSGCPTLVSISLYRCNITDAGLAILGKSCLGLEYVNLSYCAFVSDHGVRALSTGCLKLHLLIISYCKSIEGTGLRGCPSSLTYLEADSCLLNREGLLAAVSGGGLEYLNVSSLRCWSGGDGLDGIGSGFASRLRFLNLRLCRFVGDESVEAIAKGCPLLEEWNLAVCHEVRVRGWQAIGSNCQNLRILHVNRCQNLCDAGLQALQNGCKMLMVLYFHGCRQVTSLGLELFKQARWVVKIRREECVCVGPRLDRFYMQDWHPFLPPTS